VSGTQYGTVSKTIKSKTAHTPFLMALFFSRESPEKIQVGASGITHGLYIISGSLQKMLFQNQLEKMYRAPLEITFVKT